MIKNEGEWQARPIKALAHLHRFAKLWSLGKRMMNDIRHNDLTGKSLSLKIITRSIRTSEHAGQNAVGWLVPIHEGFHIDDHLLAHIDAPFMRGRTHMGQQCHFAGFCQL